MSEIWTPSDLAVPEPKQVTVQAEIRDAKYHKLQGFLAVLVRLSDGTSRSTPIHKSACKYGGRPFDSVPPEEVDAEMERTAEAFRRAKGRKIRLTLYDNQV